MFKRKGFKKRVVSNIRKKRKSSKRRGRIKKYGSSRGGIRL